MTRSIYTTMRPDLLLEVDDAEHADLAAQGLILAEINPETGEVIGGASYIPAALDAAETLADDQELAEDQEADEADSSGG